MPTSPEEKAANLNICYELYKKLYALGENGQIETKEADDLREQLDGPWDKLTFDEASAIVDKVIQK